MYQLIGDVLFRILDLRRGVLRKPEIDVHVVEVPVHTIHLSPGKGKASAKDDIRDR